MTAEEIGTWVIANRPLLWRLVRRFALHIPCGSLEDAFADLVVECYRVLPLWDASRSKVSTFIWACAANMSRNLREKSVAAKRDPSRHAHRSSTAEDIPAPRTCQPDVIAEGRDELALRLQEMESVSRQVGGKHGRAMVMRYMEHRSWAEIAEALGYKNAVSARQTTVEVLRRVRGAT